MKPKMHPYKTERSPPRLIEKNYYSVTVYNHRNTDYVAIWRFYV